MREWRLRMGSRGAAGPNENERWRTDTAAGMRWQNYSRRADRRGEYGVNVSIRFLKLFRS